MIHIIRGKESNSNIDHILVLLDFSNSLLNVSEVPSELDVDDACLAALEHDVLELLHVPVEASKDGEDMCEDAHFVEVSDGHLAQLVSVGFLVHAVCVVNGALGGIFLNNADSFLTDGGLRLLGGSTDMVTAIDTGVLSNRVSEGDLLGASGLAIEDVSSEPESLVGLKVSKEVFLIHDCSTGGIEKHCIGLHVSKEVLVDQVLGLSGGRRVNAHKITALE